MNYFLRSLRHALVIITLLIPVAATAQQQTGWRLDPHAGLSAAFLQPAATAAIPYDWDLTLGALGAAVSNNYSFLRNASGLGLLRDARTGSQADFNDTERSFLLGNSRYQYDFPQTGKPVSARMAVEITGPSFSVQVGRFTRVGAFTRLRGAASVNKLDQDLNFYPFDAFPNGVDIPIDEAFSAGALWGEAGLHVSRAFLVGNDAEIRFGLSPRLLLPVEGISGYSAPGGSLQQLPGDSIIVQNARVDLNFTDGLRDATATGGRSGTGFALDLGVQYAWGESDATGYRFTAGISVLDLGSLSFSQRSQTYRFANTGQVLLEVSDYSLSTPDSIDLALTRLSLETNNTASARNGNTFSVGMPTTISAQFGFRPVRGVKLSASYRGDAPVGQRRLHYGQELVTAIHFSRWWYGGGLTAGFYDWREFNVGIQLRLGPVYFGTDRLLGTVLRKAELYGGSFYAGLRITDFTRGNNGKSGSGRKRSGQRGGQQVKCYEF